MKGAFTVVDYYFATFCGSYFRFQVEACAGSC
jgi:hypothetical protein